MATNDNVEVTVKAKFDDEASSKIKSLESTIDKIKAEVTTTAKADTNAAESKLQTYKDKLASLPKSVSTKADINTKEAKEAITLYKTALKELEKTIETKANFNVYDAERKIQLYESALSKITKFVDTNAEFKTANALRSIEAYTKKIKEVDKEIKTKVSVDHTDADKTLSELKKEYASLKALDKDLALKAKVSLDSRSAHASLNNLKAKLDALKNQSYAINASVRVDGDVRSVSSLSRALGTLEKNQKDFSININMGSTEKILGNLETLVERIKSIDKKVHISFSSEGFGDLSNELKEIYGLLKGINKYKDIHVTGRANVNKNVGGGRKDVTERVPSTESAQKDEINRFKTYQQQLSDLAYRGQQAHQKGDAEELHRLGNEYAFVSRQMQDYVAKMGMVDYNGQAKMLTPIIQRLKEFGVIAQEDYGILEKLKEAQRNFDNNLTANANYAGAAEKVMAHRNLAEQARNNGDMAGYNAHMQEAIKYKTIQQQINDEMKRQVDLAVANGVKSEDINRTLEERIKLLKRLAQDSYNRGDLDSAKQYGKDIMGLQQKKAELDTLYAKNPYDKLNKEAKVISAKLAVELDKGSESAAVNSLRRDLINKTMEATERGIESGAITASTAISKYNAMIPIALKIKDEQLLTELQNKITAIGGTPINLRVNAQGEIRKVQSLGEVYKELQREAVQAADKLDESFKNNSGIEEAKRKLDEVLRKIREIKQANGDFSYGGQADFLKRLASKYDKDSGAYDEITRRAKRSRARQREVNSDSGDSKHGGFSWAGAFAYITRFIGRSSKGWGSFGEALSQAVVDLQKLSGSSSVLLSAIGKTAVGLGALVAVASAGAVALNVVVSVMQTVSSALQQIGALIYQALKPGLELYKNQQSSRYSFAAALMSNGYDAGGKNHLKKNDAMGVSNELITRAQFEAEMSAFSLDDILKSLQGTLPVLMAKGMSLAQAYDINKGVAGVAKMLQLAPSQILQETRDLAQGSITARGSQVAGALGVTNKDLAGKSADEIWQFLMEKFKNYSGLLNDFEDTALGRAQQLDERLQLVSSKFVESLSMGFKGIFEGLIQMTGAWKGTGKDANGNAVNATYDSIKQRWINDATGEVLDKTDENGNVIEQWKPDKSWFELADALKEAKDALVELVELTLDAGDAMLAYVEDATGIDDPIEIAKEAVATLIGLFEICFDCLVDMVGAAIEFEQPIITAIDLVKFLVKLLEATVELLFLHIKRVIGGIVVLVAKATLKIKQMYNMMLKHMPDFIKIKFGLTPMDEVSTQNTINVDVAIAKNDYKHFGKTIAELTDPNQYYTSYKDMTNKITNYGEWGSPNNKHTLSNWWYKHYGEDPNGKQQKSNTPFNRVKGNPNPTDPNADKKAKAAQRAADKAHREAIRESQRMLRERQQALKELLEDKLDDLKELLDKNKIAYDQGFLSIQDYYKNKEELEKQEAEARLQEAQEERAAIEGSQFDSEYQKLSALHKVDREIRKYSKQIGRISVTQREMTKMMGDYTKSMNNTLIFTTKQINSILRGQVQNGSSSTTKTTGGKASVGSYKTGDKTMDYAIATAVHIYNDSGKIVNPGLIKGLIDLETNNGESDVFKIDNNLGGITWDSSMGESRRGSARPVNEGGYYEHFTGPEDATKELARVLELSRYDGLYNTNDPETFVSILKSGGYMTTNDLSGYVARMKAGADKFGALGVSLLDIIKASSNLSSSMNSVAGTLSNSVTDILTQAETNGHLLNAEMPHLTEGCVEAVVRLGSWFSPVLKNEFDKGVAYIPTLIEDLQNAGIKYDTDNLSVAQPGDVLVVNGGNHVVMVKDAEHTVGNSSYNNPNTSSGSGIMEQDMSYWLPRTVGILRTGDANAVASGIAGGIPLTAPSGSKDAADMYNALTALQTKYMEIAEKVRENIFGEEPDLATKFRSEILEIEKANRQKNKTPADEKAISDRLKALRQNINITMAEWLGKVLDFDLSHLEYTAKYINQKLKYGENKFDDINVTGMIDKYFDYFYHQVDTDKIKSQITKLSAEAIDNKSILDGSKLKTLNKKIDEITKTRDKASMDTDAYEKSTSELNKLLKERTRITEDMPADFADYVSSYGAYKDLNDKFWVAKQKHKDALSAKAANDVAIKNLEDAKKRFAEGHETASGVEEYRKAWKKTNDKLWEVNQNDKGYKEAEKEYLEKRKDVMKYINDPEFMEKYFHTKELEKLRTKLNDAKLRPAQWIAAYEKEFAEAQSLGNVQLAEDIRKKINSLKEKLFSMVEEWMKTISSKFDTMKTYFDAMPWLTNLEKEEGDSEIEMYRNQELYNADKGYYDSLNRAYTDFALQKAQNVSKIDELETKKKALRSDKERAEVDKQINELTDTNNHISQNLVGVYEKMGDVMNRMNLEKLMGRNFDLLEQLKFKSKQALEDGLVQFLTDGVNEAKSFKEAFGNMLMGILKQIQEFFAKKTVDDLMKLIGGDFYHTTGNGKKDLLNRPQPKSTFKDVKNNKEFVVNYSSSEGGIQNGAMTIYTTPNYYKNIPNVDVDFLHKNKKDYTFDVNKPLFETPNAEAKRKTDELNKQYFYTGKGGYTYSNNYGAYTTLYNPHDAAVIGSAYNNSKEIKKEDLKLNTNVLKTDTTNTYKDDEQYHQSVVSVISGISEKTTSVQQAIDRLNQSISQTNTQLTEIKSLVAQKNNTTTSEVDKQLSDNGTDGHATGGFISGEGTSTSDSIPAMLSNGEYVVKASSVQKYGTNFLNAVNSGAFSRIPTRVAPMRFADGGMVAAQETARGMTSFANNLGTHVNHTTNMNVALVNNQQEAMAHFMKSPRGQRIMLDFSKGNAKFSSHMSGLY